MYHLLNLLRHELGDVVSCGQQMNLNLFERIFGCY